MQNYEQNNIATSNEKSVSELIYSPDNPPWNSGAAILVWLASVFFIALVPTILAVIYLVTKGVDLKDSTQMMAQMQDPGTLLVNIVGVIPAHLLTILLAFLIVSSGRKYSITKMLGWEWGGFRIWHLLAIVIVFFVIAGVVGQFIPEQENDFLRMLQSSRSVVLAVAVIATFSAPLVEEVVYRGVLYSAFQRTFGVPGAVGLVTLLFALVHVPQYYPSYVSIGMILLLSLVITLIRVKSRNLLPCIILHTVFNGIQSAILVAEPYLRQLGTQPENHPAFFFWQ